jgi:hypothetical protein
MDINGGILMEFIIVLQVNILLTNIRSMALINYRILLSNLKILKQELVADLL